MEKPLVKRVDLRSLPSVRLVLESPGEQSSGAQEIGSVGHDVQQSRPCNRGESRKEAGRLIRAIL